MLKKASSWAFIIFPLASIVLYLPSWRYGFVKDFLIWLDKYDLSTFSDLSHCFNYPGLHHFFHLINYTFYQTVGNNLLAWSLLFNLLHGINGFLVYKVAIELFKSEKSSTLPWFAGLFFICNPYQAEVVTWNACLHYLMVTGFMLSTVLFLFKEIETGTSRYIFASHLLFLLALFTLEFALVIPVISAVVIFFYADLKYWKKYAVNVILVHCIILGVYFFLNQYLIGDWVGHYGAEKHLNFDLMLLVNHAAKYFCKHFFFISFLPYPIREKFYAGIEYWPSIISLVTFVMISIKILFLSKKKDSTKKDSLRNDSLRKDLIKRGTVISLGISFICLLPILNLFFYILLYYANYRYSYFSMPFFCLFIAGLLTIISGSYAKYTSTIYLTLLLFLTLPLLQKIKSAADIKFELLSNFNCDTTVEEFYFLSMPDNYQGIYVFGDYTDDARAFRSALNRFTDVKCEKPFFNVAQVNMAKSTDGFIAELLEEDQLKIKSLQYGNWYWRQSLGLTSYEAENYFVELRPYDYLFTIKNPNSNQKFLWHEGEQWKSYRFN